MQNAVLAEIGCIVSDTDWSLCSLRSPAPYEFSAAFSSELFNPKNDSYSLLTTARTSYI